MNIIPKHIAIIMDGNGRWAKQRGLERSEGHKAGARQLFKVADAAMKAGVEVLSLYAFSTENWNRPEAEVNMLMRLFAHYSRSSVKRLNENGVRLLTMGRLELMPEMVRNSVKYAMDATAANTKFTINIGLNYGGRAELADAVTAIMQKRAASGDLATPVTEEEISGALYNPQLPPPDMVIRPGGEMRLSNFMLWEASYAELYFSPVLWPDFGEAELQKAFEEFAHRNRRFGKIK